ncbi:hypothetical protein EPH_0071470 [Eimeria praecox]|uniref:Uncharacterized protein n=1 Tax=Eimeria praecox TaxID=51316 RepID=U6H4Z5_9EIME|nr:hypothetical protein EPH_0071470 [Eimeria praecox]
MSLSRVREEVARLVVTAIVGFDRDELLQQQQQEQQQTNGVFIKGQIEGETAAAAADTAAAATAAAAAAAAAGRCSCGCDPTATSEQLRLYIQQQAATALRPLAAGESPTAADT